MRSWLSCVTCSNSSKCKYKQNLKWMKRACMLHTRTTLLDQAKNSDTYMDHDKGCKPNNKWFSSGTGMNYIVQVNWWLATSFLVSFLKFACSRLFYYFTYYGIWWGSNLCKIWLNEHPIWPFFQMVHTMQWFLNGGLRDKSFLPILHGWPLVNFKIH